MERDRGKELKEKNDEFDVITQQIMTVSVFGAERQRDGRVPTNIQLIRQKSSFSFSSPFKRARDL
jgi:hypothetical protein